MRLTIQEIHEAAETHGLNLNSTSGFEAAEQFATRKRRDDEMRKQALFREAEARYCGGNRQDKVKMTLMQKIAAEKNLKLTNLKDFAEVEKTADKEMQSSIGAKFIQLSVKNNPDKMRFSKMTTASDILKELGLSPEEFALRFPDWTSKELLEYIRLLGFSQYNWK